MDIGNLMGAGASWGAAQAPLSVTHPKHFSAAGIPAGASAAGRGGGNAYGAGSFESMLQALDGVSAAQQEASALSVMAVTDPDSVDAHDLTIAQAKAQMSLNITRNILSRAVQGWKDIINVR